MKVKGEFEEGGKRLLSSIPSRSHRMHKDDKRYFRV